MALISFSIDLGRISLDLWRNRRIQEGRCISYSRGFGEHYKFRQRGAVPDAKASESIGGHPENQRMTFPVELYCFFAVLKSCRTAMYLLFQREPDLPPASIGLWRLAHLLLNLCCS